MSDQMSWSIRLPQDTEGQRRFEELLEYVRELLAQQFPASNGYHNDGRRLGGPMDGAQWSVTRGPFRADVGVQRFARARAVDAPPSHELRVVASAGLGDPRALDPEELERRVVGWAMASWSIGTLGLGALWIGSHGLLTGWAQILLLLPAATTWRAAMTMLMRRAGCNTALPAPAARPALSEPELHDGLRRWRELLPVLEAQRERLQRAAHRPFRSPGLVEPALGG